MFSRSKKPKSNPIDLEDLFLVLRIGLDGKVVYANARMSDAFHRSAGFLEGVKVSEKIFGEDGKAINWDQVSRTGAKEGVYLLEIGDQNGIWMKGVFHVADDEVKFIGTDVTDLHKTAEANSWVVSAIDDSMIQIQLDNNGVMKSVNQKMISLFGYSASDVIGKSYKMLLPQEAGVDHMRKIIARLRANGAASEEAYRVRADGSRVLMRMVYHAQKNWDGGISNILVLGSQISSEKEDHETLSVDAKAVNSSFLVLKYERSGEIVDVNDRFCEVFGGSRDDYVGRLVSDLMPDLKVNSSIHDLRGAAAIKAKRLFLGGQEVDVRGMRVLIEHEDRDPVIVEQLMVIEEGQDKLAQVVERLQAMEAEVGRIADQAKEIEDGISEITHRVSASTDAVKDISSKTKHADAVSGDVKASAKQMEGLVDLIRNIASQIDLLALNATIEAARAGDAGKGFAVVAGEVKNLATQTSATNDKIAQEIKTLLDSSKQVAVSTSEIDKNTDEVSAGVEIVSEMLANRKAMIEKIYQDLEIVCQSMAQIRHDASDI